MIKLNRKVEYGLVALRHMNNKPEGELTSVREICSHYGTPFDPVAHVMRILNSEGLVQSEQGAHGGYRLRDGFQVISLAAFIEMIEGQPLAFAECLRADDSRCQIKERCNVVDTMGLIHARIQDTLSSLTLGELLSTGGNGGLMTTKEGRLVV